MGNCSRQSIGLKKFKQLISYNWRPNQPWNSIIAIYLNKTCPRLKLGSFNQQNNNRINVLERSVGFHKQLFSDVSGGV